MSPLPKPSDGCGRRKQKLSDDRSKQRNASPLPGYLAKPRAQCWRRCRPCAIDARVGVRGDRAHCSARSHRLLGKPCQSAATQFPSAMWSHMILGLIDGPVGRYFVAVCELCTRDCRDIRLGLLGGGFIWAHSQPCHYTSGNPRQTGQEIGYFLALHCCRGGIRP